MLAMHEILGLTGIIVGSTASFRLRTGRCEVASWSYLISMVTGNILSLYTLSYDWNLTAFVVNVFWLMFNIHVILKCKILQRESNAQTSIQSN